MSLNIPEQVLTAARTAALKWWRTSGESEGDVADVAARAAIEYWEDIRCDIFHRGRNCDCEDERDLRTHRVTLIPAGNHWFWRCTCGHDGRPHPDVSWIAQTAKFHAEGKAMNDD